MNINELLNLPQDPLGDYYLFMKEKLKSTGVSFEIPVKMSVSEGLQVRVNNRLLKIKSVNSLIYYGPFCKYVDHLRSCRFPLYSNDILEVELNIGSFKTKRIGELSEINFKVKELDKCLNEIANIKSIRFFVKVIEYSAARKNDELMSNFDNLNAEKSKYLKKISFSVLQKDDQLLKTVYSYITQKNLPEDFLNKKHEHLLSAFNYKNNFLTWDVALESLRWFSKKTEVRHIQKYQKEIEDYINNVRNAINSNAIIIVKNLI